MKKVRFETSVTADQFGMSESECHSPRPFIERRTSAEPFYDFPRVLPYSNDPVIRYESSNSSPYPSVNKTCTGFPEQEPCWKPSDDLDLSLLDASGHEPRQTYLKSTFENRLCGINDGNDLERNSKKLHVLSSIENNTGVPPNVLVKDSSFFIRRDNLDNYHMKSIVNPLHNQFNHLNTGKENNPLFRKAEIMKNGTFQQLPAPSNHCHIEPTTIKPIIKTNYQVEPPMGRKTVQENYCRCHHCVKTVENIPLNSPLLPKDTQGYSIPLALKQGQMPAGSNISGHNNCPCSQQPKPCPHCIEPRHVQQDFHQSCACQRPVPQNAVETCACRDQYLGMP
ncbi:Uncharacterized protein OBRU01_07929 [Operophtera brumata]|uniref:Uncharacterized protein n=1 Tax=Operophtera brumata TaxID=104452 RepID=A0A0L7LFB7_OPEBR|nr:Uncharacterized protein OBRU01_07929 [Operophtera brumata]